MTSSTTLSTLDRIQLEIKESIQREKELKNGYAHAQCPAPATTNGKAQETKHQTNPTTTTTTNGFRKFSQNALSTKGVMHKFIKSRGKLGISALSNGNSSNAINNNNGHSNWTSDAAFRPAKITVEKGGKPLRNGYVSAEEKMKRELQDFQQRETQLRAERRKSQPNLMAALQLEEENEFNRFDNDSVVVSGGLKATKSMANLYNSNSDDGFEDNGSSAGGSLKPARSLAELCDVSDDEGCLPGTHSLIMQFENMQFKNRSSSQSSKGSYCN